MFLGISQKKQRLGSGDSVRNLSNNLNKYTHLTSKPPQPYRGTFKPDLAVFVNLDMLITNLLSFFPAVVSLSSTSASKFEFIECLRGAGATGCI